MKGLFLLLGLLLGLAWLGARGALRLLWRALCVAAHALAVALFWAGLWYCRAWRSRRWWLVVAVHSPAGAVALLVSDTSPAAPETPPAALVLPAVGLVTLAALVTARAAARATPASTTRAPLVPHRHLHRPPPPLGEDRPGEDARMRTGELRALASEGRRSGGLLLGLRQTVPLLGVPPEPPPRAWLVPDLIPCGPRPVRPVWHPWRVRRRGYVTGLAATQGTGKSYVELDLGIAALTGGEWLGLPVARLSSVLYVDLELDEDTFWQRAYALARGRLLPGGRPPRGLHYLSLAGEVLAVPPGGVSPIGDSGQARIVRAGRRWRPGVVLVDSLTLGGGLALGDAEGWGRTLRAMEQWGPPVVAIDHLTKSKHPSMVGSFAKMGLVRGALLLERLDNGRGIEVSHIKSNFGRTLETFRVEANFAQDEWGQLVVSFTSTNVAPGAAPPEKAEPQAATTVATKGRGREAFDQAVLAAFRAHDGPASPKDVAQALGKAPGTVANSCSRLKARGLLENVSRGLWQSCHGR